MDMGDLYHLHRRKGVYYYRRRVPADVQPVIGKNVIQFSLGTTVKGEAKRLRERHDQEWSSAFDCARHTGDVAAGSSAQAALAGLPVSKALALRLVQQFVEAKDRSAEQAYLSEPLESEDDRRERIQELEIDIQTLKDRDDPNGDQTVYGVSKRLLREVGLADADLGNQRASFDELVRRGLLEVDFRKLARLLEERQPRRDPMFGPARSDDVTFGVLSDQYLSYAADEARSQGLKEKTFDRTRANVALVRQLIGDDTLVGDIDFDRCQEVRRALSRVPSNLTKRYKGLSVREAIEKAAGVRTLGAITQSQYLTTFRDILGLAVRKRLMPSNPADGLRPLVPDEVALAEKRHPFSDQQLVAFFNSAFYKACAESGPVPYRHDATGWRFWLPLLCLYMGLRPREALQLHAGDVKRSEAGTLYLDVNEAEEEGTPSTSVKSLKTASSRRRIPIHPVLVDLGFMHLVADRIAAGKRTVFPQKANRYGDPAAYPLKRFNEAFLPKEMPGLGDRQSFYSFRHSFRDGLRAAAAGPEVLSALGWSQGSRVVSDNYGAGLTPDQLTETLRRVAYDGLDLSHLRANVPVQGDDLMIVDKKAVIKKARARK